ncbi:C-C motif chemokine 3-like [Protobothrops mucrosquamatus]|uniref:C-C motif chemokine 3-like n=1 Tax=Protobothrops mucrosquamatus TaxID=103944 RepID=UPI0007757443|nr:C-C motif chemokine 3-like [Protobothrops mucrosquamatus]
MKTLFAFLLLVVSVTLDVEGLNATSAVQSDGQSFDIPTLCCYAFMTHHIPLSLLKSFEYTSSGCSQPGVVFITKRGIKTCANPLEQWVQDYIHALSPP